MRIFSDTSKISQNKPSRLVSARMRRLNETILLATIAAVLIGAAGVAVWEWLFRA